VQTEPRPLTPTTTEPLVVVDTATMPDLAPMIHRQRLVIEGTPAAPITDRAITTYLSGLSAVCGMVTLIEPVTHRSERYGWAGWIHWETSGAHFYAWEQPLLFFSVDIYTCRAFSVPDAVEYTRDFFAAREIVAKAF
jgi:S-adenosylmethionine decarboxylase